MKNYYLILIVLFFSIKNSFAQYSVNYSTDNYTDLVSADTVDESLTFTFNTLDINLPVPIGFSFEINGEIFDSVAIAQRGFAMFRNIDPKYSISVFDCELKDFNDNAINSPILYTTEGAVGNRIFKCEYKMMGFVNDPENDDFVSVQLWLYESCNDFEVRIGNYSVNSDVFLNSYSAPYIGFSDYNNTSSNQILTGVPTNPTIVATSSALDTIPPVNSVYTFSECSTSIREFDTKLNFYPNPVNNNLYMSFDGVNENTEVCIIDLFGRKVSSFVVAQSPSEQVVDLTFLSRGSYVLRYQIAGELYNYQIIKN